MCMRRVDHQSVFQFVLNEHKVKGPTHVYFAHPLVRGFNSEGYFGLTMVSLKFPGMGSDPSEWSDRELAVGQKWVPKIEPW